MEKQIKIHISEQFSFNVIMTQFESHFHLQLLKFPL